MGMKGLIIRWLILTGAVAFAAYVIDGIRVDSIFSAFFATAALGLLNAFFRPILIILTLPLNIMTLGLFTLVINALLLKMASGVISGFEVHGFWSAVVGSLVISLVNWILSAFVFKEGRLKRVDYMELKNRGDNRWE